MATLAISKELSASKLIWHSTGSVTCGYPCEQCYIGHNILQILLAGIFFNLALSEYQEGKAITCGNGLKFSATGMIVAYLGFIFGSLFLNTQYYCILWVLLAFTMISYRVSKEGATRNEKNK